MQGVGIPLGIPTTADFPFFGSGDLGPHHRSHSCATKERDMPVISPFGDLDDENAVLRAFDKLGWSEFLKLVEKLFPDQYAEFVGKGILEDQNAVVDEGIEGICKSLLDTKKWTLLAAAPKDFHRELEQTLRFLRQVMQWRYGMPGHRAAENANRDQQIFDLRKSGLTFGQIALKLRMKSQSVRQAYDRYNERQKAIMRAWLKFARQLSQTTDATERRRLSLEWYEFLRIKGRT